MAISEAQKKANKKYFDNNYKQVKLSMPIKEAEALENFCKKKNCSKAGFIRDAIKEKIERDSLN
jgi:predicted DNA-binding protein